MIKETFKKTTMWLVTMLFLFQVICFAFPIRASAEIVSTMDYTKIEDDLSNIDLSNYPENALGDSEIISFMEYCYSNQNQYRDFYGIYIYVYNPTREQIVVDAEMNKVSMRIGDSSAQPQTYYLEYLDSTDDRLFYKYKLGSSTDILVNAQTFAVLNDDVRRYEITELTLKRGETFESLDVSNIYEWTGYGAYLGDNNLAISTLECKSYGARSIHLTLQQTNYRFAADGYIQDELNSVFFTIPKEYFDDFGNLNSIHAEWYEYKTTPMYVTSDDGAYSGLWYMRGVEIDEFGIPTDPSNWVYPDVSVDFVGPLSPIPNTYWRVFWDESVVDENMGMTFVNYFGQTYNGKCRDDLDSAGNLVQKYSFGYLDGVKGSWRYWKRLDWLFHIDDVTGEDAYCISKDEVKKYMEEYTKDFPGQSLIRGKYSQNLFIDSIDQDRISFLEDQSSKNGYVSMDFVAGESYDPNIGNSFVDSDSSQSAWNKFWFGTNYETVTYSPIQVIKEGDLVFDEEAFSTKYYVNINDAENIQKAAKEAYYNDEIPVLLRFAVTDYYASAARFDYAEEDTVDLSDQDGYVAQETVFLDFDVISLGFKNENGYEDIVIGVVADPIDIINGLTPPEGLVEDEEWWQKIMMVLCLILLFALFTFISGPIGRVMRIVLDGIKSIISVVISIATLPLRLMVQLFKNIKNRS